MAKKFLFGMLAVLLAFGLVISCAEPFLENFDWEPTEVVADDTTGIIGKWYADNSTEATRKLDYFEFKHNGATTGTFTYTFDDELRFGLKSFSGIYSVSKDNILTYVIKTFTVQQYTPKVGETAAVTNAKSYNVLTTVTEEYLSELQLKAQYAEEAMMMSMLGLTTLTTDDGVLTIAEILEAYLEISQLQTSFAKTLTTLVSGIKGQFFADYEKAYKAAYKTWLKDLIAADTTITENVATNVTDAMITSWQNGFIGRLYKNDDNVYEHNVHEVFKYTSWAQIEAIIMEKGSALVGIVGNGFNSNTFTFKGASKEFDKAEYSVKEGLVTTTYTGEGFQKYLDDIALEGVFITDMESKNIGTDNYEYFEDFTNDILALFGGISESIWEEVPEASESSFLDKAAITTVNSFLFTFNTDKNEITVYPQVKVKEVGDELVDLYDAPGSSTIKYKK